VKGVIADTSTPRGQKIRAGDEDIRAMGRICPDVPWHLDRDPARVSDEATFRQQRDVGALVPPDNPPSDQSRKEPSLHLRSVHSHRDQSLEG
jgi:hypothetical protein